MNRSFKKINSMWIEHKKNSINYNDEDGFKLFKNSISDYLNKLKFDKTIRPDLFENNIQGIVDVELKQFLTDFFF
jgi:hypothetical protein